MSPIRWFVMFTMLVLLVALQRLWELGRSRENEKSLRARGAREHAPRQMPWMRALHASWLASMLIETWVLEPAPSLALALPAIAVFTVGQALRISAMRALGDRWNVKIFTLPGAPAIRGGVFEHVRHPNYLGVVLEIASLPLVGGAVITSIVFSIANGMLLFFRIRAEEEALRTDNDYRALEDRPLFVPRLARRE